MNVLSVTSEFFPLIKTGGLADVAGALPAAVAAENITMRTLLPGYPSVLDRLGNTQRIGGVDDLFGGSAQLLAGEAPDGSGMMVIEAPHLYERAGNPYLDEDGRDWADNPFRFAALAWVASRIGLGLIDDWKPDLVHGHDWQAGLLPVYLNGEAGRPVTLVTIHNLAFQGVFPAVLLSALRLPLSCFTVDGVEFYGQISFLKAALSYADHLTTVSPSYAREICTPAFGMGLDGVLRERRAVLTGITNGIDSGIWDPTEDPNIERPFSRRSLQGKAANKAALQARFELAIDREALLFCVISRLTSQKGFDLLLDAITTIIDNGGQLVLLGSGDAALEAAFAEAARDYPGRIGVVIGYDEPLSHQMQAGADAIIVPSRFEPCGLTQLYGLRYGTLPIVARVGGLADTVVDANQAALIDGVATGFQFAANSSDELCSALERAFALFADQRRWQMVQRRAMGEKVDWSMSAKAYADLYRKLCPSLP